MECAILPSLAAPAVCEDDGPIMIGPNTSNTPMFAKTITPSGCQFIDLCALWLLSVY